MKNKKQDACPSVEAPPGTITSPRHESSWQQPGLPGEPPNPAPNFILFYFFPLFLLKQQGDSEQQRRRLRGGTAGEAEHTTSEGRPRTKPPASASPLPPPRHRIAQTALGMDTKIKQLCGLDIYIFLYIYICIYIFFVYL